MVVGESGLGKSTLINSLFLTDLYPDRQTITVAEKLKQTVKLEGIYLSQDFVFVFFYSYFSFMFN